ncbi:class I SAM-dependent methyltransferase [Chitinophaga sp. Hz27]|uniref:class I SAM-dependent methyltransferase n=1 Tax=Chitinophaga sp. Hz27 TaxID=3347169 RepID=UPI0035DE8535
MKRKLEKEVMDDTDAVSAYAEADFKASNQLFIDRINSNLPSTATTILDLGCGPADIPVTLAKLNNRLHITAVDASKEMLDIATTRIQKQLVQKQVELKQGKIPGLETILGDIHFDIIISKDMLHHLPAPLHFWREIKRFAKSGTMVYVMDLLRPHAADEARSIVETVAANEADILKEDFYNSLLAAFTLEEILQQLTIAGLALTVAPFGTRHFLASGIL